MEEILSLHIFLMMFSLSRFFFIVIFCFAPVTSQPTNCILKMSSFVYDFSRLSGRFWNVSVTDKDISTISFSLCNETHLFHPCGSFSMCITYKNNTSEVIQDSTMSATKSNNNVKNNINVMLKGSSQLKNFQIMISFRCSEKEGSPKFVSYESDQRLLSLNWTSDVGCAFASYSEYDKCRHVKFGSSFISLLPLASHDYYSANDKNDHLYYISLCGRSVPDLHCNSERVSVCMTNIYKNESSILGYVNTMKIERTSGLTIVFKKPKITKIELVCNTSINSASPQNYIVYKEGNTTHRTFELQTEVACINSTLDCFLTTENQVSYNLAALRNKDYIIKHTYNEFHQVEYHLKICQSFASNEACPYGVSVCQRMNDSILLNLGSLNTDLQINENGEIFLTYYRGALCLEDHTKRYETQITFYCSLSDSQPILDNIYDCKYYIKWMTKAACPLVVANGSNCKIYSEGYEFNLNPLRNIRDYVLISESGTFHLNICAALLKPCNNKRNYSVCLTRKVNGQEEEFAIGETAESPHYEDGRITFVLKGDGCQKGKNSSTVTIIFKCSHINTEKSFPEPIHEDDNCNFYFIWSTGLACPNYDEFRCLAWDKDGEEYDLSKLSDRMYPFIVFENTTNGIIQYYVSICRPVMFGYDTKCLSQTGICMFNKSESNRQKSFRNLGKASDLLFNEAKQSLEVIYKNGDMCSLENGKKDRVRSTITFVCDHEFEVHYPELVSHASCTYDFIWKTRYACSKKTKQKISVSNCRAYNPYFLKNYDLNKLAGEVYKINHNSQEKLILTLCGNLNISDSEHEAGICVETENGCDNFGRGNKNLLYDGGKLFLNYTDGDTCEGNRKKFTVIYFLCDKSNSGPKIIQKKDNCSFSVYWGTEIACTADVPCTVDNSVMEYNLSLLVNNDANYEITVNDSVYLINICRMLVPSEGLLCEWGSSACKVNRNCSSVYCEDMSLGYFFDKPSVINGQVILRYNKGTQCSKVKAITATSSIIFICDPKSGKGAPVLIKSSECDYQFIWKTSVVCLNHEIDLREAVKMKYIYNHETNFKIDFQSFCGNQKYNVSNYVIHICHSDALITIQKKENDSVINYGHADKAVFIYSENVTRIYFSYGEMCHFKDSYAAVLTLLCDQSLEISNNITIVKEMECSVEIVWRLKDACAYVSPENHENEEDFPVYHANIGLIIGSTFISLVGGCLIVLCYHKAKRIKLMRCCNNSNNLNHRNVGFKTSSETCTMLEDISQDYDEL